MSEQLRLSDKELEQIRWQAVRQPTKVADNIYALLFHIGQLESLVQQREQERDAERAKRRELQRLLKDECSPK